MLKTNSGSEDIGSGYNWGRTYIHDLFIYTKMIVLSILSLVILDRRMSKKIQEIRNEYTELMYADSISGKI
jgi:hypothetical protein